MSFGHQGDVGCLDRGIAADRAHGNAEIGSRESRRVINAVADHRNGSILAHELLDPAKLVRGQQLSMHLVDANRAADCLGRHLVVACEHDHVSNADRV